MQNRGERAADCAEYTVFRLGVLVDVVGGPRRLFAWDPGMPVSVSQLQPCVVETEEDGTPWCSS